MWCTAETRLIKFRAATNQRCYFMSPSKEKLGYIRPPVDGEKTFCDIRADVTYRHAIHSSEKRSRRFLEVSRHCCDVCFRETDEQSRLMTLTFTQSWLSRPRTHHPN